ncbi:MAG: hypothetical protein V7631_2269, partial [Massilia sp.]
RIDMVEDSFQGIARSQFLRCNNHKRSVTHVSRQVLPMSPGQTARSTLRSLISYDTFSHFNLHVKIQKNSTRSILISLPTPPTRLRSALSDW